MIIDMDTHILPPDIYDYVEGLLADQRPQFELSKDGLLVKWSFPGNYQVKGTTPLPPLGAGMGKASWACPTWTCASRNSASSASTSRYC